MKVKFRSKTRCIMVLRSDKHIEQVIDCHITFFVI